MYLYHTCIHIYNDVECRLPSQAGPRGRHARRGATQDVAPRKAWLDRDTLKGPFKEPFICYTTCSSIYIYTYICRYLIIHIE